MNEPPINGAADSQDRREPSQPEPIPQQQPPVLPPNPINPYAMQWAQYYASNVPYQHYPVHGVNWHQQGPMFQQYSGYPAYTYGIPQYGQPNQYSQPSQFSQMSQLGGSGLQDTITPHEQTQHPPGMASMQAPPTIAPMKKERKKERKRKVKAELDPGKQQNATPTLPASNAPVAPANKHKDKKIMLPGPTPNSEYLAQAAEEPFVIDPPDRVLVILDLNGTLIFRPNPRHQATRLIARPFLKPFLRYLFENFSVIVWSSAKPENVKVIVENVLDDDLRSMLVACLARDSFKLQPHHYSMNVQVYKDLNIIWEKEEVQQKIPDYEYGKRFGQHNTVLIDDSTIKAVGQPHNLLLIPEFCGTAEQMEGDVLREVAGYLEVLKMQWDVSKFMRKEPFKADGRWVYDWDWEEDMDGGELKQKVSLTNST